MLCNNIDFAREFGGIVVSLVDLMLVHICTVVLIDGR